MAFTEDGKYILSSAVGERYIAIWNTDGAKKQSASCVLALEHPPVFVDSWGQADEKGLYVLAISEIGVGYFWYGSNVEELSNAKPTKVALATEDSSLKHHKGSLPLIFAAKLQGVLKPGSAHAFIASGLLVKPSFQKMVLQFGTDLVLNASKSGILLPIAQSVSKSKKGQGVQNKGIFHGLYLLLNHETSFSKLMLLNLLTMDDLYPRYCLVDCCYHIPSFHVNTMADYVILYLYSYDTRPCTCGGCFASNRKSC